MYADPKKKRECCRRWREKNRDRIKTYRVESRDKTREYRRSWRRRNGVPEREILSPDERLCRINARRDQDKVSIKGRLQHTLQNARKRAKIKGLSFSLKVGDLLVRVPETCPIFGIPLGTQRDTPLSNRYSLDRIDSQKGYDLDNVQILSQRANTLKNNMTLDECRKMLAYMEAHAAIEELCA